MSTKVVFSSERFPLWLVRSGMKSLLTAGPFRKKLSQLWPTGAIMRLFPLTRTSTLCTPGGRRTSKESRTAWVRLLIKTVPTYISLLHEAKTYNARRAQSSPSRMPTSKEQFQLG